MNDPVQASPHPTDDRASGKLPTRKRNRLDDAQYRTNGAFFITICTDKREHLFWGPGAVVDGVPSLSPAGKIADNCIPEIAGHYTGVAVSKYAIMPNHVHLILSVVMEDGAAPPDVRQIVRLYKGSVSRRIGRPVWQKGFYDHIIRNETEYGMIWKYIDDNPRKWAEDEYCGVP